VFVQCSSRTHQMAGKRPKAGVGDALNCCTAVSALLPLMDGAAFSEAQWTAELPFDLVRRVWTSGVKRDKKPSGGRFQRRTGGAPGCKAPSHNDFGGGGPGAAFAKQRQREVEY